MADKRRRFEAQVLPHLDAAYRFARWLARSPDDADDVVQEAIVRAYRGFDALRGSDVKAWLLAIVRNCHSTALRQQQRRAFVPLPEENDAQDGYAMTATTPGPERAHRHGDVAAGALARRASGAMAAGSRRRAACSALNLCAYRLISMPS